MAVRIPVKPTTTVVAVKVIRFPQNWCVEVLLANGRGLRASFPDRERAVEFARSIKRNFTVEDQR